MHALVTSITAADVRSILAKGINLVNADESAFPAKALLMTSMALSIHPSASRDVARTVWLPTCSDDDLFRKGLAAHPGYVHEEGTATLTFVSMETDGDRYPLVVLTISGPDSQMAVQVFTIYGDGTLFVPVLMGMYDYDTDDAGVKATIIPDEEAANDCLSLAIAANFVSQTSDAVDCTGELIEA